MSLNRRKLSNKRRNVHRTKTRDRRPGYVTPTPPEEKCPNFIGRWVRMQDDGFFPDFIPVCENEDADCDYKKVHTPGVLTLCHRYWKTGNDGYTELGSPFHETLPRQKVDIRYTMERRFVDKHATVRMILLRNGLARRHLFENPGISYVTPFTFDPNSNVMDSHILQSNGFKSVQNTSYLEGYYMTEMTKHSTYSYQYSFHPLYNGDDDSIVSIFRYNPDTGHYYSVEWNRGGLKPPGFSIKKHICLNKETKEYTQEVLYFTGIEWNYNEYNAINVDVYEDKVVVRTGHRQRWRHGNHYHYDYRYNYHETNLPDKRLATGTYGFGTISQSDVTFSSIHGDKEVERDYRQFDVKIPLSKLEAKGAGFLVSQNIGSFFNEARQLYLDTFAITREDLHTESYQILSDNVTEIVPFSSNGKMTSKDPNDRLFLDNWDYDKEVVHNRHIEVNTNDASTLTSIYHVDKDLFLIKAEITFDSVKVEDGFYLDAYSRRLYDNNVVKTVYATDLADEPTYLGTGMDIMFTYEVKRDIILLYQKDGQIDTHNKVFTIKNGELHWHEQPSRVRLPEYELHPTES